MSQMVNLQVNGLAFEEPGKTVFQIHHSSIQQEKLGGRRRKREFKQGKLAVRPHRANISEKLLCAPSQSLPADFTAAKPTQTGYCSNFNKMIARAALPRPIKTERKRPSAPSNVSITPVMQLAVRCHVVVPRFVSMCG